VGRETILGVFLLASGFLFAGCGKSNQSSTAASGLVSDAPDPCTIALMPHSGNTRIDLEISRLQQRAVGASVTAEDPLVEELGWAYIAKARESFDPGYYKLAEQAALCVESRHPDSPDALLLYGHVLHSLHKFKEAEALAHTLVTKRGQPFDYGLLGDVLMEQGHLADAADAYQHMMDLQPGPQAYSRAAHLRWLKGDLVGAIELMQMAAHSDDSRNPEPTAWANVRLALYELQAGEMNKAGQFADVALALQNDYAPALLARGRILLAQNRPAEAADALTRAAALNPLPEYEWVLSEALRAANRNEQALAVETKLKRRGANDDPRTYSLFLSTRGEDAGAALRLATRELDTRQDVFTFDALAWAALAAGNVAEAQVAMARALAEGTQDARLFYHAAVIAQATGNAAESGRWRAKANALQQMLLPSEREQLAALQNRELNLVVVRTH
jgi:tetratricopeptide (TPR) repeat protein